MPLYDYDCEDCGHEFEEFEIIKYRNNIKCKRCKGSCKINITRSKQSIHIFPEGVWEHIAIDPVYVNDKKHLKQLCKQHGVYATGVLDG